jgi:hypothetical protein
VWLPFWAGGGLVALLLTIVLVARFAILTDTGRNTLVGYLDGLEISRYGTCSCRAFRATCWATSRSSAWPWWTSRASGWRPERIDALALDEPSASPSTGRKASRAAVSRLPAPGVEPKGRQAEEGPAGLHPGG